MKWQKLQKVAFVVFIALVVLSLLIFQSYSDSFNLEEVRQYMKDFGVWAPLIFIILYTFGTIFVPSTPPMIIAGIFFGFWYGLIYTFIGSILSAIIVFILSRKLGKEGIEKILAYKYLKHLGEYNKRLEEGAVWDLILLRVVPFMPFNALNILMGVSRIKTRDYIVGTIVGLIPSVVLAVYAGTFVSKIF